MENNFENLNPEPDKPYPIPESVMLETEQFLERAADPNLRFEEWQESHNEFEERTKGKPEYRLAYLRLSTKNPDVFTLAEIHNIEHELRARDKKL